MGTSINTSDATAAAATENTMPLSCRRRLVDRRTHEGMTKHHRAVAHPNQSGPLGLVERLRPDTERLGRSEDNRQSTGVLSSRDEQRPTCWPG